MRAVHILARVRSGDGGPAYTVPRLCKALAANGADLELLTVSDGAAVSTDEEGYRLRSFVWNYAGTPVLHGMRASSEMQRALCISAQSAEVIHDHGLWQMPNIYAGRAAMRAGKPLVVTPRGMLSPAALSFSRVKKSAFWHLLQKSAIAHAACFHATSEQEYRDIRAAGFTQPVAIVPNGVDIPARADPGMRNSAELRTILSLGRIHPIKGLDILLDAWRKIAPAHPDWQLRIVGPDANGYAESLRTVVSEQRIPRVSIEEAVYGDEKQRLFAKASLFVLPSRSENFGVTVAEALAAGVPAIATTGAPWQELVTQDCGWWIECGVDPLASAMTQAMGLPAERLRAMGAKGRRWAQEQFSWARVARDMLQVYAWITGSAECPSFVCCR